MLAPWEAETGLGAANWVLDAIEAEDDGGSIPGIEGFEDTWVVGVADMNSSNSSSSVPLG